MTDKKYSEFVTEVTSEVSNSTDKFIERIKDLESSFDVSKLLTGVIGLNSEYSEYKQIVLQNKKSTEIYKYSEFYHIHRELGDIIWYVVQICNGLWVNFEDLVLESSELMKNYLDEVKVIDSELEILIQMNESITNITENIKKVLFQGKNIDNIHVGLLEENLKLICSLNLLCRVYGKTINEIIEMNIEKLKSRYKGGFSVQSSENRAEGDI